MGLFGLCGCLLLSFLTFLCFGDDDVLLDFSAFSLIWFDECGITGLLLILGDGHFIIDAFNKRSDRRCFIFVPLRAECPYLAYGDEDDQRTQDEHVHAVGEDTVVLHVADGTRVDADREDYVDVGRLEEVQETAPLELLLLAQGPVAHSALRERKVKEVEEDLLQDSQREEYADASNVDEDKARSVANLIRFVTVG